MFWLLGPMHMDFDPDKPVDAKFYAKDEKDFCEIEVESDGEEIEGREEEAVGGILAEIVYLRLWRLRGERKRR